MRRQSRNTVRQGGADVPYQDIRVINPSRGLDLLVADFLANDKEATQGSKNIEYSEGGVAGKRMGYTAVGTGLSTITKGLGSYSSEGANYPITSDGGIIKKYQSGMWTTLPGAITLDPTANITFTSLFQKTYGWDGVNGGVVFDGTTVTRPGTMPKARFSVIYKGYHVSTSVDGQPFRLYFAPSKEPSRFTNNIVPSDPNDVAINDATQVPGATVFAGDASPRAIDINRNDGQRVTGLGFFQDVLIVFKENSIYQLSFNDSNGFVVQRITTSYGAVCHGAIASVENDCYFLTEKGIYVLGNEPNFYAAIRTNELSSRIKPLLQQITAAQYDKCKALYYDDRYWLSVPINNTEVNALIVYDRRFYAWAYWDNIAANSLMAFKDKDGDKKTHFYFMDAVIARMNEFTPGVYNDNGAAITAIFRTHSFEGKQVEREKYWYTISPVFRTSTGEIQISYITENGQQGQPIVFNTGLSGGIGVDEFAALLFGTSAQDTYTDADLGLSGSGTSGNANSSSTDSSHTVLDVSIGIDARVLKVEFKNDRLNETFGLLGWVILYQTKDHMRRDGRFTYR